MAGVGHIESIIKREREMSVGAYLASSLCPCYSVLDHSTLDEVCLHSWRVFSVETSLEVPLQMLPDVSWVI